MKVKMILPALTEATSPYWRPIKYSLFPPLGLATLAGYLNDDDEVTIQDEHVEPLDLDDEPDGPADFGIYGDRAVGTQELDERSRTVRFTLAFDRRAVRLAADRWDRLKIYAISVRDLLDRAGGAL